MNAKPLCIYHHGCADGFAAAWVVRKFFRDNWFLSTVPVFDALNPVDFHPGIYGEAPPDVAERDVILVDFSYKRDVMLSLIEQARSVLVLDHHKTAQAELENLPGKAVTIFDMDRSGAMIAWNNFFPGQMPPLLLDHIQDRDLWRFRLPMTREITAALFSYPMTFEQWDELMVQPILQLEHEGRAILRKHQADVAAIVRDATRSVSFGEVRVPCANVPWMYASDVAGELAKGRPFAATYYDDATGRRWSLRSTPEGADVAMIAQAFGGGGHKHAAGFRMTREEAIDFEVSSEVF